MLLSIIIPVYNHAKELEECVGSILSQSHFSNSREWFQGGLEVIIVNDGSTDDVEVRIRDIELRITERGIGFQYIKQENRGAAAARNVGFDHSTGEYLFFCDADIRLQPDALEKMFGALKRNRDAAFAYSQFRFGWKTFTSYPFDPERLKQLNYIHTSSLIRRSFFPRFDESLKKFQDWDLFLTIAERGGVGVLIPEVLYTITAGGTMSQWVPSFAYRWPWAGLPWWNGVIEKYNSAKEIIRTKHGLTRT